MNGIFLYNSDASQLTKWLWHMSKDQQKIHQADFVSNYQSTGLWAKRIIIILSYYVYVWGWIVTRQKFSDTGFQTQLRS